MSTAQLYLILGIIVLMLAIVTQITRGIFKVAQVKDKLDSMAEDIIELKVRQSVMDERIYGNALRNTQRR